jgi:hypothetical protein
LQQAVKINPQSQIAQSLLQQTEQTGISPSIVQLSNIAVPVENIQNPDLFSQPTPPHSIPIPEIQEPSTSPRQPTTPPSPVSPEKIYFRDDKIFVSNAKIVFNQTTIPIFQVISSSCQPVQPIWLRILGGVLLLVGGYTALPYLSVIPGMLVNQLVSDFLRTILTLVIVILPTFAVSVLFIILGFIWLFVPRKKYRVIVETSVRRFTVITSKEQKYADTIAEAVKKALAEQGSYIPQPVYSQGVVSTITPSSQIAWAWIIFVLSFGIPIALTFVLPQTIALAVAAVLQITALVLSGRLWANPNPTAKAHGMAITIIWLALQCISGIIAFLAALSR